MSYLKFDKEQLINLEYSMNREILRSNRAGSYISTTLNGCNTRKYHGLLVCPIENFGGEKHVLLSSLDVSIVQGKEEFNLGIHRYKGGVYYPKGHKYIQNIEFDHIPAITYRIGSVVLTMERILIEKKEQVLIKYTLEKAPGETTFRIKPFLAFRNIHGLSKANMFVNSRYQNVENGISTKLYEGYPNLFMQFSRTPEYVPVPDWYFDIEYFKELTRGYDFLEDLFVPGYFELKLNEGESVVFSAGTEEINPVSLKQRFTRELNKRTRRYTFASSLHNAAEQFILHKKNKTDVIAGYPWYNSITRQTFISLPGLAHALNSQIICEQVLKTYEPYLNHGLFPDSITSNEPAYNSADAPLWYIWAIQQYDANHSNQKLTWGKFGSSIKTILEAYYNSLPRFIEITPNGLLHAEKENTALTWMNSYVRGTPAVQRAGLAVEINALWYNSIGFAVELAEVAGEKEFAAYWKKIQIKTGRAFLATFWNQGHEHLADVVRNGQTDWAVRPNMVIAAAMKYSPLSTEQKKSVLSVAKKKLLTKRGLRTLSPDHLRYKGSVDGNQDERESAIHQGATWPWLMQFFVETYLKIHGRGGLPFVKQLME
ncbi:MAG TPA: glycogen debranching enzyme N-terminal domain-containing protein, partial [Tangfeifania sp.]|nr:glycogen debranching enzyme N-terminal domain-containing protein [Tangfeifania sp.]